MKQLLSICLIFSLSTNGYAASSFDGFEDEDYSWASEVGSDNQQTYEDESCDEENKTPLHELFEVKCRLDRRNKDALCRCLDRKATDNILLKTLTSNSDKVKKEKIENRKKEYMRRFEYVYSKMTIEAGIQERVLGLEKPSENDGGFVGCTPRDNAAKVRDYAKNYYAAKEKSLRDLISKREGEYNRKCGGSGVKRVVNNLFNPVECNRLKDRIENIHAKVNEVAVQAKQMEDKGCPAYDPSQETQLEADIAYYKEMLASLEPGQAQEANNLKEEIAKGERLLLTLRAPSCPAPGTSQDRKPATGGKFSTFDFDKEMKQFSKKATSFKSSGGQSTQDCDEDDKLCETFKNLNYALKKRASEKFDPNPVPQDECVNFAEYQLFKSRPSDAMIEKLATKRGLEAVLDTPTTVKTALEKDRLEFLRSNPVLVKLASSPENKKILSTELHKLSKGWKELKSDADKFRAYLDFMKGTKEKPGAVKRLYQQKQGESTEMFVCSMLQKNFTAITVADNLPPANKKSERDDNFSKLVDAYNSCDERADRADEVDNVEQTLATDPLFTLSPPDSKENAEKEKADFNAFKAKICADYPKHVKEQCGGNATEDCREKFLAHTSFADTKTAMNDYGVDSDISSDDISKAAARYEPSNQNNAFKNWWETNVGSKMSKNPMYFHGDGKSFEASRASDARMADQAIIPPSLLPVSAPSMSSSPQVAGSQTSAPIADPSQVAGNGQGKQLNGKKIEDYYDPKAAPVLDKKALRDGAPVDQAISGLTERSAEEQVELLKSVKESLGPQDEDIEEKIDQHIAKVEKQVEKGSSLKADEKLKKEEVPSQRFAAGGKLNGASQVSQSARGQNQLGSVVNNSQRVELRKLPPRDNTKVQMNNHLVNLRETLEGLKQGEAADKGRSPASVGGIVVEVGKTNPSLVDVIPGEKDLPRDEDGKLKILRDPLEISNGKFIEIVDDEQKLEGYLVEQLKGEVVGNEIIQIRDAGSDRWTTLHVKATEQGLFIKRVRSSELYKSLTNQFKTSLKQ